MEGVRECDVDRALSKIHPTAVHLSAVVQRQNETIVGTVPLLHRAGQIRGYVGIVRAEVADHFGIDLFGKKGPQRRTCRNIGTIAPFINGVAGKPVEVDRNIDIISVVDRFAERRREVFADLAPVRFVGDVVHLDLGMVQLRTGDHGVERGDRIAIFGIGSEIVSRACRLEPRKDLGACRRDQEDHAEGEHQTCRDRQQDLRPRDRLLLLRRRFGKHRAANGFLLHQFIFRKGKNLFGCVFHNVFSSPKVVLSFFRTRRSRLLTAASVVCSSVAISPSFMPYP